LIEVVMLFQKSLELQGKKYEISGKLADLLTQYAGMLASQGCLSSALTYLSSSQNPDIEETRERLFYSLGHKQLATTRMQPQPNVYAQQQPTVNRFTQPRTSLTNNTPVNYFGGGAAQPVQPVAMPPQTQAPNQWNTSAVQTPFPASTGLPPPPPGGHQRTVCPMPAAKDPLSQPPRPSSVNSQQGGQSHRSKYVLDPSVQSGPSYGQTVPNAMYNPQNFNSQPNFSGMPTQPQQQQQPSYNQFNTNPGQQQSQTFSPPPNNFQPFTPTQSSYGLSAPVVPQNQNIFNPPPQSAAFPPSQQGDPNNMQRNPTPPPGWNDPPALKTNRTAQVSPEIQYNFFIISLCTL
jgi:protein transport protein SEC31